MMPQVLFFVFLVITTVVGVWKDLGNGYFSLALAWNATNTLILGASSSPPGGKATAAARAAPPTGSRARRARRRRARRVSRLETAPTGGVA